MTRPRAGARRAEIISTLVVVLLVAAGTYALWPRGGRDAPEGGAAGSPAVTVADSELAALRAAAGLAPCPSGTGGPAAGPIGGITVPCLGGPGETHLAGALSGRTALLNVWATWCPPCREELPVLAEYAARPGAVPVVGINVQDDPRAALTLLDEIDVTVPSVTDPADELRVALEIPPGLPMSYVLQPDGSIRRVDPPIPFTSADEVAAAVERFS